MYKDVTLNHVIIGTLVALAVILFFQMAKQTQREGFHGCAAGGPCAMFTLPNDWDHYNGCQCEAPSDCVCPKCMNNPTVKPARGDCCHHK